MRIAIAILLTLTLSACAGAYVAGDVGAHKPDNLNPSPVGEEGARAAGVGG